AFERNISQFLGWNDALTEKSNSAFEWIKDISVLGDRSKEDDNNKKNNWQAGTDFEIIVRKGLEFLGFKVEEAYRGGAGGLDLFCSEPYPLVGECKAGKKIPSDTTEELVKLGGMHLDADRFLSSAKLIIGPGEPNPDVLKAASKWRVSIIKPMTLQKLVEFHAKYPGSINLVALKKYLEPGKIDHKIEEYIEEVSKEIQLRSHIIQLVKKHLKNTGDDGVGIDTLHGAYVYSEPPKPLKREELRDILIELSSPLVGHLGRYKDSDGRNQFYFLRDLTID
ncbi:MAG TPA: hypothetical protein V6C78_19115, partial [Crinalium sp.]